MTGFSGYYLTGFLLNESKEFIAEFGYKNLNIKRKGLHQEMSGLLEVKPTKQIEIMSEDNVFKVGQRVKLNDDDTVYKLVTASIQTIDEFNSDSLKIIILELE